MQSFLSTTLLQEKRQIINKRYQLGLKLKKPEVLADPVLHATLSAEFQGLVHQMSALGCQDAKVAVVVHKLHQVHQAVHERADHTDGLIVTGFNALLGNTDRGNMSIDDRLAVLRIQKETIFSETAKLRKEQQAERLNALKLLKNIPKNSLQKAAEWALAASGGEATSSAPPQAAVQEQSVAQAAVQEQLAAEATVLSLDEEVAKFKRLLKEKKMVVIRNFIDEFGPGHPFLEWVEAQPRYKDLYNSVLKQVTEEVVEDLEL